MEYSDTADAASHKQIIRNTFILDIWRGLAALYVLIGHARWLLWEGYSSGYKLHPEEYNWFGKLLVYGLSVFSFGYEAVMVFFVLSGFVIQYSSYNQFFRSGNFSTVTYIFKRFKRIYPPFLCAILLTWMLDSAGRYYGYSIYTGSTQYPVINSNISSDLSWNTLLGNLSMVQILYTPVWGTNGPLWSLTYEWWFYMLFIPVFFINRKAPLVTAYLIAACFVLSVFFPPPIGKWLTILYYFFAWYVGVVAADIYMGRIKGVWKLTTLTGTYAILTGTIYITADYPFMRDIVLALVCMCMIYLTLYYSDKMLFMVKLQILSDFSYSLYVIHMPVLVLLSGWLQQSNQGALPKHFGYFLAGIIICLVSAWGIHFLAEKPFVRKRAQ